MRPWIFALAAAIFMAGCASESAAPAEALFDSDGDGYPDDLEVKLGSDPHDSASIPDVMVHAPISFTGSGMILAGTEFPMVAECGTQGIDTFSLTWPIAAPADAQDAHVVDMVITATLPETMVELDLYVYGPTGDLLTEPTTMTVPPAKTDSVAIEGKQEAGDYRIEVRGCLGSGEVPIEATAVLGYMPSIEELLHQEGVEHHH